MAQRGMISSRNLIPHPWPNNGGSDEASIPYAALRFDLLVSFPLHSLNPLSPPDCLSKLMLRIVTLFAEGEGVGFGFFDGVFHFIKFPSS